MQQGDYSSSYYQYHHPPHLQQNPNPNTTPTDLQPSTLLPPATYASAPPFDYPSGYHPSSYPHNPPDPIHQTDPSSYAPNPNYQSYNQPPSSFNPAAAAEPPYSSPVPPPYYPSSYDHHHPNYAPPAHLSTPTSPSSYGNPSLVSSMSMPPVYQSPYETNTMGASLDQIAPKYGVQPSYTRSRSDAALDFYDKPPETAFHSAYDKPPETAFHSGILDDVPRHNVYAYDGGKVEPYGARGTAGKSSIFSAAFDDYGRSLSNSAKSQPSSNKVMKAVPKAETQQDVKNGVQKFRVKLLAETGGQTPMDVLCQIGLDGIRMLDPNTSRTLRIYPLETITRSEILDSSIFAFWSKSTVDIEPRRIRLKSSSYTTNTILDTVTAATFQLKEIGGKDSFSSRQSDTSKQSEQSTEKKKGFTDWVNLIKPGNEEKDHWVPDEAVTKCTACATDFGAFVRRHHCRNCGDIFCDKCTHGRIGLTADEDAQPVRVCDRCLAEVTQRLSNTKESASKPAALCSHEDLAKKLQEEMDKNRKASSGSKSSDGSGRRMKEVACPTCTVHLQVQVPSSGSETIECGVCQHPFLVSAH